MRKIHRFALIALFLGFAAAHADEVILLGDGMSIIGSIDGRVIINKNVKSPAEGESVSFDVFSFSSPTMKKCTVSDNGENLMEISPGETETITTSVSVANVGDGKMRVTVRIPKPLGRKNEQSGNGCHIERFAYKTEEMKFSAEVTKSKSGELHIPVSDKNGRQLEMLLYLSKSFR